MFYKLALATRSRNVSCMLFITHRRRRGDPISADRHFSLCAAGEFLGILLITRKAIKLMRQHVISAAARPLGLRPDQRAAPGEKYVAAGWRPVYRIEARMYVTLLIAAAGEGAAFGRRRRRK